MSLTARDLSTGAVIFAFDEGIREATCRDDACGAKMAAVRAIAYQDVTLRRAHWRHVSGRGPGCRESHERMTVWHQDWQAECDQPERVEQRIANDNGTVRVADILTPFGWVVEVQHSAIDPKTARQRENHYRGRVLWLYDAATEGRDSDVDLVGDLLRWTAVPHYVTSARTLRAVDTGPVVYLLPAELTAHSRGGDLLVPARLVTAYTRTEFVAAWINGTEHPMPGVVTEWDKHKRGKKPEAKAAAEKRLRDQDARRAVYGSDECQYVGDRGHLVLVEPPTERTRDERPQQPPSWTKPAPKVPTHGCGGPHCRVAGCPASTLPRCAGPQCLEAARPSGWCHTHEGVFSTRPTGVA